MKTCPQCGQQYPDTAATCPQDGVALQSAGAIAGAPPSTTLATVSLVLGLLSMTFCGLFAGLPAIISGHIAYARAKRLPAQFGGGTLAMVGFITGYISIFTTIFLVGIAAGLFLPALAKAKSKAVEINCANNLKQIGLAARIYAGDHNDRLPTSFLQMTNELINPSILICPADTARTRSAPGAPLVWSQNNISYQFVMPGVPANVSPNTVIVRCPIHGTELYADGSVHIVPNGMRH